MTSLASTTAQVFLRSVNREYCDAWLRRNAASLKTGECYFICIDTSIGIAIACMI